LRGILSTAGDLWHSLDNLINDRPIKVAVTGLSRSGKTVFITSLIANLLAMGTGKPTMPALRAHIDKGGSERLRNIRLVPARASTTPRFDYPGKLADLAGAQPKWPARTEDLAEIELEGFVSDVRPAYRRASLVLAPLTASAGTNIKVLEAMAMGRAVVATPAGINGLDLSEESWVAVGRTAAELADWIHQLSADDKLRRKFERAARSTALKSDWREIGKRQSDLYRSLL